MGGTPQPSEVGRVAALERAPRIVVSAFTRHVGTDITGARSSVLMSHLCAGVISRHARDPMCRLDAAAGLGR
jgi:hypothetical protein